MPLLEKLRNMIPGRRKARPETMISRFEMTGLHELSSSIEFRRDTASNLMVIFFGALTVFIMAGLWIGTFSKQETMRGVVLGTKGGQRITATVSGTVSNVWVEQGQAVAAGQKLVSIAPQQASSGSRPLSQVAVQTIEEQLDNTKRRIKGIQQLMERDAEDLRQFEISTRALADNLQQQESDMMAALAAQEDTVRKLQRYLKVGYATRESLTLQERARQDYKQQLSQARIQLAQLRTTTLERQRTIQQNNSYNNNEMAELQRFIPELTGQIERARADISTDILATGAGRVAAINLREGSEVAAGDTVAALGDPDAPFTIGLQAPSKTIGLLTIGQRVVLKYDAFPFKTFGVKYGKIIAIAKQPLTMPKIGEPPPPIADPRTPPQSQFLIEVEPDDRTINAYGIERPILIGSTLSADIVVERRRLIDWVLDPILAMRGRF